MKSRRVRTKNPQNRRYPGCFRCGKISATKPRNAKAFYAKHKCSTTFDEILKSQVPINGKSKLHCHLCPNKFNRLASGLPNNYACWICIPTKFSRIPPSLQTESGEIDKSKLMEVLLKENTTKGKPKREARGIAQNIPFDTSEDEEFEAAYLDMGFPGNCVTEKMHNSYLKLVDPNSRKTKRSPLGNFHCCQTCGKLSASKNINVDNHFCKTSFAAILERKSPVTGAYKLHCHLCENKFFRPHSGLPYSYACVLCVCTKFNRIPPSFRAKNGKGFDEAKVLNVLQKESTSRSRPNKKVRDVDENLPFEDSSNEESEVESFTSRSNTVIKVLPNSSSFAADYGGANKRAGLMPEPQSSRVDPSVQKRKRCRDDDVFEKPNKGPLFQNKKDQASAGWPLIDLTNSLSQ